MTKWLVSLLAVLLLLSTGCQKRTKSTAVPGGGKAPVSQLEINITRTDVLVAWGMPAEIPIEVQWKAGQKYAVQLSAPDAPAGMEVELDPAIVDPPGRSVLRITPVVGEAMLTDHTINIEASAYGMSTPLRKSVTISVTREDGEFIPVYAGDVTVECRNVCGKLANGRVTFYDVLREKNQSCGDKASLPESQKIGTHSYGVSNTGFGYARTCRVAAIFETGGTLSLVNIGAATPHVKRGDLFATITGGEQCWFSPDNSIILVKHGSELRPYDVYSGQPLGNSCRLTGEIGTPVLAGKHVSAGSCEWTVP
jgi:hypothetical protein